MAQIPKVPATSFYRIYLCSVDFALCERCIEKSLNYLDKPTKFTILPVTVTIFASIHVQKKKKNVNGFENRPCCFLWFHLFVHENFHFQPSNHYNRRDAS